MRLAKFSILLALVSFTVLAVALEEEEEDPSRPGSPGDFDETDLEPLDRRRLRHQRKRNRRLENKHDHSEETRRSSKLLHNDFNESVSDKRRRRRRRLRHKTSKFSDETFLNDDNFIRRKSFRTQESFESSKSKTDKKSSFGEKSKQPNIILIITDDQDVELGSLQFMPKLNRFLRQEGASFDYGYVSTPMCCPSRSSMLTGLYVHNHNVLTNNDNCSSPMWVEKHEPRTFGKYLNNAGYKTGFFGKYLNKYNGNHIPEGWDEWMGLIRNSRFYNYSVNVNGNKIRHGFDYAKDYFPDLITNDSLAFFRQSKQRNPIQPVLMIMSYPGPHGPEDSAPQYADLFFNVTTHHTPAYDYAPNPDKQWILQVTERMEPIQRKFTDLLMTKRLQTLQSIDEAVERLYYELVALGELDNTYIFYTSDHGYHLGQFGLVKGKSFPFDVDTKVPFIVRGPGIEKGSVLREPVVNIDLAPTFLDLGGVSPLPLHMDGRSLVPLFVKTKSVNQGSLKEEPWRHAFLIERGKMTTSRYQKIQHRDEMKSLSSTVPRLPNATVIFDNVLEDDDDRGGFDFDESLLEMNPLLGKDRLTKQERLAVECLKPRLQAPCQLYQSHKCVKKKGHWKIKRCHSHRKNDLDFDDDLFPFKESLEFDEDECLCDDNSSSRRREKRLQRRFIKKHLSRSGKTLKPKFMKDIVHEDVETNQRYRRHSSVETQEPTDVESVLTEMADQDIVEVDIIMEDIADEIKDLQNSMTSNGTREISNSSLSENELQCQLAEDKVVNCSSQVYKDKGAWKSSRSYINDQIRRLRAQLFELKEIRKHLKLKRPFDTDVEDDDEKLDDEQHHGRGRERCKCKKLSRKERRLRNRERRLRRRERVRLLRLKRRLRRKEQRRRKSKREKVRQKNSKCPQSDDKLNCFTHNNEHWKTAPFWTDGSFCACTNSNTNTYSCVRNVNATHNYLYCEFVSGIITYYDLNIDPHQLRNIYQTLSNGELNYMHRQLLHLKKYRGSSDADPKAQKMMEELGNPAQISKKSPFWTEPATGLLLRGNTALRQEKFVRRYGQYLPPPNAYRQLWK